MPNPNPSAISNSATNSSYDPFDHEHDLVTPHVRQSRRVSSEWSSSSILYQG